jgi:hypothetical protein
MSRDERARSAGLSDAGLPPALVSGELEVLGLLPNASNGTFLARARLGDDETLAVYKPRRGEAPLWDFPEGTLCRREVAAYVVSRSLGWPVVPPTVLRDGPFGIGSVQRFVRFDPSEHAFTLLDRFPDAFRRIALFDLIVNNADRKAGHCLLGDDGRIHVVDHGVCFGVEPKLRTVLWDFAGDPVPTTIREDVDRLAVDVSAGPLREELSALLDGAEVESLARRVGATARLDRFPAPDADRRAFPWPPI